MKFALEPIKAGISQQVFPLTLPTDMQCMFVEYWPSEMDWIDVCIASVSDVTPLF